MDRRDRAVRWLRLRHPRIQLRALRGAQERYRLGLSRVESQGGRLRELWLLMGARGVQQLRQTAIELQLAPIRASVHIPVATLWAHFQGGDVDAGLAELEAPAGALLDDLLWWTAALKAARASAS